MASDEELQNQLERKNEDVECAENIKKIIPLTKDLISIERRTLALCLYLVILAIIYNYNVGFGNHRAISLSLFWSLLCLFSFVLV